MANDITGINSARTQQSGNRAAERIGSNQTNQNGDKADATTGSDKVSLTSTAARLKDLERQLADQSPVDSNRVNAMKTALSSGEFKVDAERVADKMMNFESSLDK